MAEKLTRADVIWNQIKNIKVDIYALPNQTLEKHVERVKVSDDSVHIKLNSPAILPAMEEAMSKIVMAKGERFDISAQKNYTIISIVPDTDAI